MSFRLALFVPVMLSILLALHPKYRQMINMTFKGESREILSSLTTSRFSPDTLFRVLKVKTPNAIMLEFYRAEEGEYGELLQRIALDETRDAYINVSGKVTNLIVDDIDGDSSYEIIAPTYDDDMVARLNVFKFNPASDEFQQIVTSPSL